MKSDRYNVKEADWDKYREELEILDSHTATKTIQPATETATEIESAIIQAAKASIPKRHDFPGQPHGGTTI